MHLNFSPQDEKFIKSQVEQGFYSNSTELVRDAVRRLREHDEKYRRLVAAIEAGEADIRAGRVVEYTPELRQQIMDNAKNKAASGHQPNPDVMP